VESDNFLDTERMDYERWSGLPAPSIRAGNRLEGGEPSTFAGWLRRLSVSGLTAVEHLFQMLHRFERTHQDVRLDESGPLPRL